MVVSRAGPGARVAISALPLLALWALGFTGVTPFYPTIVVGAAAMVVLTLWVWRAPQAGVGGGLAAPDRADRDAPDPAIPAPQRAVSFPSLALRPAHVPLAVGVALIHYLVGLALFLAASRLLPAFAATASTAYDRAGTVPLWTAVLLGGIVSAPLEEVFWRGAFQPVVMSALERRVPSTRHHPLLGIVVAAAGYALFHAATLQLALVAAAALGGLVWGWLLHRTRSLGAVMLAHGLWTTLMLLYPPA